MDHEAVQDLIYQSLQAAGVEFNLVPVYANGSHVPRNVLLASLGPAEWDAVFSPTWVFLPPGDAADMVDAAMRKWDADPEFRKALEDAYFRERDRSRPSNGQA